MKRAGLLFFVLVASACGREDIQLGGPVDGSAIVADSGGGDDDVAVAPPDAQILDAYRFLAVSEGVFCEPASAASVAGLLTHGVAEDVRRVVCVLTGHGLKDPQTALEQAGAVVPCDPELSAIERAVLG